MFRLLVVLFFFSALTACSETPSKKVSPKFSACGNGVLDVGELCDHKISAGEEGACPTECGGDDACTTQTLVGSAVACTAMCETETSVCTDGDGCCGLGCDSTTDDDCTNTCGNGTIEAPETCDGDCGECDDGNTCTANVSSGDASTCSQTCTFEPVTACVGDDGCCPSDCDSTTDSDCSDSCGDGVIDPNETCDGDCPTTCEDNNDCTDDVLLGNPDTCSSSCMNTTKTACRNDDGCCPTGCGFANDNDCVCEPTTTCASLGWLCGTIADDGCGNTENCGTCNAAGEVCSPNNRCEQDFGIGTPCANADSCPGNGCFEQALTGIPGGYCTNGCRSNSDCGINHCDNIDIDGDGVCFKSCQVDSDCRAGQECFDFTGNGVKECMAVGSGNGPIGSPCNLYSDCGGGQGGSCTTEFNDAKDGICTDSCQVDADCAGGSHCVGGACMKNCTNDGQCRNNGYACYDADGDGQTECWTAGTGNSPIGGPCQGKWDCRGEEFATCGSEDSGFPGGFCTIACGAGLGTCPANTDCSIDVGEFCMPLCPNGNECRTGYSCQFFDVGDACFP